MGIFGAKKEEVRAVPNVAPSATRVSTRPADAPQIGIDHAIELMRTLPTDENADLVVRVLTATLESLNIRVADIVEDAGRRQTELQTRVNQLKTEIAALEKEMELRVDEIRRLEAAHEETTQVKDHLERKQVAAVHSGS
jgi:hypothetical protein